MKLTRLIPIASLATVAGVAISALVVDAPPDFPFTEPPEGAAPPSPELGIGDAVLHGLVVDGDGAPIGGAGITTKSGLRASFARTRPDGTFELTDLHPEPLTLLAVALGFQATSFTTDAWPATSEDARHTLVLDRPIARPPSPDGLSLSDLSGRVQLGPLAPEGAPYELFFEPTNAPDEPSGGFPRRTAVEADGAFAVLAMEAGEYRVILLAPEDRGGRGPDLFAGADGTPLIYTHGRGAGDGAPPLDLVATAGAVQGEVRSAPPDDAPEGGGARLPVRGALVRLERIVDGAPDDDDSFDAAPAVDATNFRATRTDVDGRFVVRDVAPGRYRATAVAGRHSAEATVEVGPRAVVPVELDLRP